MGASLLVFKNKSDVRGCMDEEEIRKVERFLGSGSGLFAELTFGNRPSDSTRFRPMDGLS